MRALQEDEDNKWKRLNEAVKTGWVDVSEARTDVGLPPDMPEVEQELPPPQPLPGQPPLAALPPGSKSREIVLKARDLEHLPELLQALVDLSEPGLERSLERYFDGQRRRVKRALVG
jgi:hypothetical protein